MKFQFGNVVVVPGDQIGCIVKSWSNGTHDVYVRSTSCIHEFSEFEIQHYVFSKELTKEEKAFYK